MRRSLRDTLLLSLFGAAVLLLSASSAKAQFAVESVSIEHGAVNVPVVTDISVTFTEALAPVLLPGVLGGLGGALPIDLNIIDPECPLPPAGIFVVPGGCAESVSLSSDGKTVTLHGVNLDSDPVQTLIVLYAFSQGGESLAVPYVSRFTTGPSLPQGGIGGSVSTSGPSPAGTILIAVEAPLPITQGDSVLHANIGFAAMDGDYSIDFMPDGMYHVIGLQVDLSDPETALNSLLIGTVDVDDDKVADVVEVAGGSLVGGADVSTTSEGAKAAELNTPALELVQESAPDAMLGVAVGAGMNLDGTAQSWIYVYTSTESGSVYATASIGPFVFPPQMLDLGEDAELLVGILGFYPVATDFGDSDAAVSNYLAVGGTEFLAEYESAIGVSVVMNAELFAFVQLLLDGGLDGFLKPLKLVFDRFAAIPDLEKVLSKKTGEVWIVAFIAPLGPSLHMVAMDDSGNPLLVLGSATARENEAAALARAEAWASDVILVTVSTNLLPVDGRGNGLAWGFNYYSPSKDSVFSVTASGGELGGVLSAFAITKEEVPSISPLPDNWIDSPAAVLASRSRGQGFVDSHADALASAVLSKGLQAGNPDLAIWRFGFTGTSVVGESEFLDVDIDAASGVFVAVEDDRVLPSIFELGQNYPNPFNPSTVIPYRVSERSHVVLEVFDALGRRLATLVDQVESAGSHEATWDASSTFGSAAPSGVYIYRLSAEGSVVSRTMMLMK